MAQGNDPKDRTRRLERASLIDLIELPNGLKDVVKTNKAIAASVSNATREMKVVADSMKTFSIGIDASLKAAVTESMKGFIDEGRDTFTPTTARRGRNAGAEPAPSPYSESPASTGRTRKPTAGGKVPEGGAPEGAPPKNPYEFQQWKLGEAPTNLTGLKRDLGKWMSEREPRGPDLVYDEDQGWVHRDTRRFASRAQVQEFEASQRRANWMKQVGGALQRGEGVRGAIGAGLPTGAMKVAGVGAAVVGVANQALDFMEGQRQANAAWRQASGGGELEAFGERAQARMFGFRMRGTMGGVQAQQLYEGIAQDMQLRGAAREAALDFAVDKFRDYAMDIRDSLTLINESLKDGSMNLNQLSDSLDNVTDAARSAGINTDVARKGFITMVQGMSPLIGGGTATALASGIQGNLASLGPQAAGIGFNVQMPQVMRWAAQGGYANRTQLLGNLLTPGKGQRTALGLVQNQMAQEFRRYSTPGLQQAIQEATERSPTGRLTWEQMEQIGLEQMRQGNLQFDPTLLGGTLGRLGFQNVDPRQMPAMLVAGLTGNLAPGLENKEVRQFGTEAIGAEEFAGFGVNPGQRRKGEQNRWKGFELGRVNTESSGQQLSNMRLYEYFLEGNDTKDTAGVKTDVSSRDLQRVLAGDDLGRSMKGRHHYVKFAQRTQRAAPAIEALFEANIKDQDKFRVIVNGEARVVTFKEALQHFPEQLASGQAVLLEASDQTMKHKEGSTVADLAGGAVGDYGEAGMGAKVDEGSKASTVGEAYDKYREKRSDKDAEKEGGTLTISATPELAQLIRMSGTGVAANVPPNYAPPTAHPRP